MNDKSGKAQRSKSAIIGDLVVIFPAKNLGEICFGKIVS